MGRLSDLHAPNRSDAALLAARSTGSSEWTRPKAENNVDRSEFSPQDCLRELKKIKLAWPELNYATAQKGLLILLPSVAGHRSAQSDPPRLAEARSEGSWNRKRRDEIEDIHLGLPKSDWTSRAASPADESSEGVNLFDADRHKLA